MERESTVISNREKAGHYNVWGFNSWSGFDVDWGSIVKVGRKWELRILKGDRTETFGTKRDALAYLVSIVEELALPRFRTI